MIKARPVNSYKIFFISFFASLVLGLFFVLSSVWAASSVGVDLTGTVSNDCTPVAETCDETWNTSLCETTGQKSRTCTDGCTPTTQTVSCVTPPPNCGVLSCSESVCVNNVKTVTCDNDCGSTTSDQSCNSIQCGDGDTDVGEECDDGNTQSGDGCSDSCQSEYGCGNGVLDAGEQCDDDNIQGGDCCSDSCSIEIIINNIVENNITNTTATIGWSTSCRSSSSSLNWGNTPDVSQGTVSLNGTSYNYGLSGLEPDTTYYYRITATDVDLQQQQHNGSFRTAGGAEICNNGIDDDSDGFCDYFASTCSDGSVAGDPECICEADFVCTPQACQEDNTQTVECVDQTVPKCEPDYEYSQECDACPGVIPGACQEVDPDTCEITTIPNCCGNDLCEPPGEDPYLCAIDCQVECLSDWVCDPWSPEPCPPNGIQSRNCFDANACAVPINPPDQIQTCGGLCPGLSCGIGEQINTAQCICEDIVPFCGNAVCETGETFESCAADCIEICEPNWTCDAWGECNGLTESRNCTDLNNCGLELNKPPTIKSCVPGCDVACGTCQLIDTVSCSCLATVECCGDRACSDSETSWSCPVDCGIPPTFNLALGDCLDGLDNDRDGFTDYPADSGCKSPSDSSELDLLEVLENINQAISAVIDNPQVEAINQATAPIVATIVAVSTAATFSFLNLLTYLRFLFTQPFAVLFRRKRQKWGVVYNSLTKLPVDLAIVRLYQKDNNRLVQSRVTDKQGRYNFLVEPGQYYMTVTKPRFDFPSAYLKGEKEDVKFLDLYHGESLAVTDKKATITANIPIDSKEKAQPARKIIMQSYLRKVQYAISFSGIPLATLSAIISPGLLTFSLLGLHGALYIVFRRLGYQKPPKNWGIIYDSNSQKPLGRVITRIYDKQYNKLLEARVSDSKGRYSFLVDNNIYYVTAEKLGYDKFKSEDIDLVNKEAIVGNDIKLNKLAEGQAKSVVTSSGVVSQEKSITPPPGKVGLPQAKPPKPVAPISAEPTIDDLSDRVEDIGVGRESLEDLTKTKQEVTKIKEDVLHKKEELEELEDKIEEVEESLDRKIDQLDGDAKSSVATSPKKSIAEELEDVKIKNKTTESTPDNPMAGPDDKKSNPKKNIFG